MNRKILFCLITLSALFFAACGGGGTDGGEIPAVQATGIELDRHELTLSIGGSETLVATIKPDDATNKNYSWSSNAPDVVSVNGGTVTALSAGDAIVTAISVDGEHKDMCFVTVKPSTIAATGVELTETELFLAPGDLFELEASVLPSDATNKSVSWESSVPSVARITQGSVQAISNGKTTITVTTESGDHKASCEITVDRLGRQSFLTEGTWIIGDQMWSDTVMATGCIKESFDGGSAGNYKADCRSNSLEGIKYGDLFSWTAIDIYADRLCPDEWSVPTAEDHLELDKALGGTGGYVESTQHRDKYLNLWGGHYGGCMDISPGGQSRYQQGQQHYSWSRTYTNESNATRLWFTNATYKSAVFPVSSAPKEGGALLRCVKNV